MIATAARRPDLSDRLAIVAITDAGRKRSHNEDRVGSDPGRGIALVADGMGGHKGGEVASGLAVETVLQRLTEGLGRLSGRDDDIDGYTPESDLARRVIEESNRIIHQTAASQPQYEGMGTTLAVALFYDDRLTVSHVGDSRVYRFRAGQLEQLTRDHTLMQELVERGFYTPEEARASLNRNIVTRALGIDAEVQVDVQEDITLPGDVYLLCSDGLNDMLGDSAIRLTLAEFDDSLDKGAQRLVDQANEQGGSDNISVVLVKVLKPHPTRRSWFKRFVDWFQ